MTSTAPTDPSDYIRILQCPYCVCEFKAHHIYAKTNNQISWGSIVCHCEEFPILNGIIYLKKHKVRLILEALRKNQHLKALRLAIDKPGLFTHDLITGLWYRPSWFQHLNLETIGDFFYKFKIGLNLAYHFYRHREQESLLCFFPLAFIGNNKPTTWLDIGCGFNHFASEIVQMNPNIQMIGIENSFLYHFLSQTLFPTSPMLRICTDASLGPVIKPGITDIVTMSDTLLFTERQRQLIEILTHPHWLKSEGFVFISSLATHLYWDPHTTVFPIPLPILKQYFLSHFLLFKDYELVQSLYSKNKPEPLPKNIEDIPHACFSLLWPEHAWARYRAIPNIPESILQKATHFWEVGQPIWQNKIY